MKKILAFDCGATNTRLALINENFKIEKNHVTKTPLFDKEKWVNNLISMIDLFPIENVAAISIGIPGVCDRENGIIIDMPNVHIKDVKIKNILEQKYNIPVFIRNDAEVACLGEAFLGAGKGKSRVFFITISSGLGGALCVDKINQDYVTEIGHTAVMYKGILSEYEKLISGVNINNLTTINNHPEITSAKQLFNGVINKNKDCIMIFNEWKKLLNDFIKLIRQTYLPDIICITGGLTKSKELFWKDIKRNNRPTKIVECHFLEDAGLIGAGVYGLKCAKII